MAQRTLTIGLACIVAALLVVAAGCGGGDSTASGLSKKQFIKQGEKVCTDAEKEQAKLAFAYAEKHPGAEEEELVVPAGLPPIEKEIGQLRELGAPEGDEAQVDAILAGMEKAVEEGREDPQSVLDPQAGPFVAPDKLAEGYGFVICANLP